MPNDPLASASSSVEITGLELLQCSSRGGGGNVRPSRGGDHGNGLDRSAHLSSSSSSSSTTLESYANDSFGLLLKQRQHKQHQLTVATSGTTAAAASGLDDRNHSWHSSCSMQSYCNDSFQLLQISTNQTSSSLNHHHHSSHPSHQPRHYTRWYTRRPVPAEASSALPPAAPATTWEDHPETTPRMTNKSIPAKGPSSTKQSLRNNTSQQTPSSSSSSSSPPPPLPLGQWSLYPSHYHASCRSSSSSDNDDNDDDDDSNVDDDSTKNLSGSC